MEKVMLISEGTLEKKNLLAVWMSKLAAVKRFIGLESPRWGAPPCASSVLGTRWGHPGGGSCPAGLCKPLAITVREGWGPSKMLVSSANPANMAGLSAPS